MTFNVWGETRWSERKEALQECLRISNPDVLVLQEVTPTVLDAIDAALEHHARVKPVDTLDEEEGIEGWSCESHIYYNTKYFTKLEHGLEKVDITDHPHRGLFWARFGVIGREQQEHGAQTTKPITTFVVSTVHMPWPGCPTEISTGVNQRVVCAQRVSEALQTITCHDRNEPLVLGGDFNEAFHPVRVLKESAAALKDAFEILDMAPPITHPVRNTDEHEVHMPDQCLDWIMVRILLHFVIPFFFPSLSLSIYCPLLAFPDTTRRLTIIPIPQ